LDRQTVAADFTGLLFHGLPGPIPNVLGEPCQKIENGALPYIGGSGQRYDNGLLVELLRLV
jgi:hypothetical protein